MKQCIVGIVALLGITACQQQKVVTEVLRGPYRSAVPLALSNGQTPPSLSIVGLSVDIAHYVRLIGYACK